MAVKHSLYHEAAKVEIDDRTCKRCGQCAGICPAEVLTMRDGIVRVRDDSPFGCIAYGHCMPLKLFKPWVFTLIRPFVRPATYDIEKDIAPLPVASDESAVPPQYFSATGRCVAG